MIAPSFQPTLLSCKCGHEWTDYLPCHVRAEVWSAHVKALRCPSCDGNGGKIFFGQKPKQVEVDTNKPIAVRLAEWHAGADTGLSSKAIAAKLSGVHPGRFGFDYPCDPHDLGRCLCLLRIIPEWKDRIGEMRGCGPVWDALVPRWDELEQSMEAECGLFWEKAWAAPSTYALLTGIIEGVERA